MLRAKVLPEVLGQIVDNEITACICCGEKNDMLVLLLYQRGHIVTLMTIDGALVGSAGEKDAVDHKVVGAIASHTWGEYVHAGREEANPAGELRTILMELEHGRLAMTLAGKTFLLCAYSGTDAPAGLLKAKVESLGTFLSASLDQIEM